MQLIFCPQMRMSLDVTLSTVKNIYQSVFGHEQENLQAFLGKSYCQRICRAIFLKYFNYHSWDFLASNTLKNKLMSKVAKKSLKSIVLETIDRANGNKVC